MKILYLDCFSGISGDMLLGSLMDLGTPLEVLETAFRSLALSGYRIQVTRVTRQGITANKVNFGFEEAVKVARDYRKIREILDQSTLNLSVRQGSIQVFEALAQVEGRIHGVDPEAVHFHEVGGLDTIFDVVGAVVARDFLKVEEVFASPLPYGRGEVHCEHGILPNPAPATLELLKGFEVFPLPHAMEFVTPTGAAILNSWVDPAKPVPSFRVEKMGYGAGDRDLDGRPNVLRAVLGEVEEKAAVDEVVLLETDIDDETPEILAHVSQLLFERGALDVTSHPVVMKKGRLGTRISVVAPLREREALSACLLTETSTLGVRIMPISRRVASREIMQIPTSLGDAQVKVAVLPSGRKRIAPEYESCARLSRKHHLPLRDVVDLVKREAETFLSNIPPE